MKKLTTFQNFGNLKVTMLSAPLNPADTKAAYMIITGIIPDDNTLIGSLYDAEDNLIAHKRVYSYDGGNKNIPFADLNTGQQGYLSGAKPDDKWEVQTIKIWMTDRQAKDESGQVVKDDPYDFDDKDGKETLLGKITSAADKTFIEAS